MAESVTIALAGQPNTGKSTLFNQLSGARQHVGNWPGKTVEQKTGRFVHGGVEYCLVDLPGTYSLTADSPEEVIARDYITGGSPEVTVVVVDASQLSRSLSMALEVIATGVPVVIALNMMDVAHQNGLTVDCHCLEKALGVAVVPLTASRGEGLDQFMEVVGECRGGGTPGKGQASGAGGTEGDILEAAIARYARIDEVVARCVSRPEGRIRHRSVFDSIAMHPVLGLILSLLVVTTGFVLAACLGFGAFGVLQPLSTALSGSIQSSVGDTFPIVASLFSQGIIPALYMIGSVSAFIIGVLLFIGFLEDVGYLPRLACVADPFMARLGLHGKSLMPLFLGLGCNIAAVMGCRVIDSRRQRYKTLIISSHMPCQGLLATIGFMTVLFFGSLSPTIAMAVVAALFLQVVITSRLLDHTVLQGKGAGMIIELPPYHRPNLKTIYRFVRLHFVGFLRRAGTLIAAIVVLVWALSYFPNGTMYDSYLASAGRFFEPVGSLMGMDWRLLTCLFVAMFSKEAALIALAVMFQFQTGDSSIMGLLMEGLSEGHQVSNAQLGNSLHSEISLPTALAFIFAAMFSIPCFSTIGAIYSETRSLKWTFGSVAYYTLLSFGWGVLAYQVGLHIF